MVSMSEALNKSFRDWNVLAGRNQDVHVSSEHPIVISMKSMSAESLICDPDESLVRMIIGLTILPPFAGSLGDFQLQDAQFHSPFARTSREKELKFHEPELFRRFGYSLKIMRSSEKMKMFRNRHIQAKLLANHYEYASLKKPIF
jgi:hypothetical protein